MTGKTITQILIGLTVLVWIIWDVYTYIHSGNASTESATLYRWAYYAPGISFAFGILCGHLFYPQAEVINEISQEEMKKPGVQN